MGAFGEMYIGEALEQDAARIVHCVNTHDQLVSALKLLVKVTTGPTDSASLLAAMNTAQQALAQAEKGVES